MRWLSYIFIVLVFFTSCSSKQAVTLDTAKRTNELIVQKRFSINCTTAQPMQTAALQSIANSGLIAPGNSLSQININGSQNYFKVLNDSIEVSLPYYGEQRIPLEYGRTNTGIQFKGIPKEATFDAKDKKGNTVLKFTFKNGREQCRAQVKIFPSGKSNILIASSHRTSINYRGAIKTIATNKEEL